MTDNLAGLAELRPARVCLIKPSSLGDVVHALPVLTSLRDRWPQARFSWVINRGLRGLVDGHPHVDEVIAFDRGRMTPGPRGLVRLAGFLRDLRRRRFDLAIDLQGLLRSGLMTWSTGARDRVGPAEAREGATRFYSHRVPTGGSGVHAVDRMMVIARALGAPAGRPRFILAISEADHRWARETLADVPRPRLVINVGARWVTKRWPPDRFVEVARRAVDRHGAGLIAVGAPEDRPLVDLLISGLGPLPCLDLCGLTTLPRLAAVAAEADAFLSNDTGPLHLAAAAGARVVGVYTCTDPARTGPYGPEAVSVRSCVWCAPSFVKACDRLECMTELTADRVWPAVSDQLRKASAPAASLA